jgi:hypothetical protein
MFPIEVSMDFSIGIQLAIAFVLGLGFGLCLERAGFGGARKLTAVFYFYDMSVVKLMFTAIVTAMAGLWLVSTFGLLNLSDIYIEPTTLAAQIIGGLLFGAGFIFGGYCPGTSVVAAATGRKDGIMFALGMLVGVYAYAELTPGLDAWYTANSVGEMTLPSLTGIGMGEWVVMFIGLLAFAAWGMRWMEWRFAGWRPKA